MTRNAVDDIVFSRWMGIECSVHNRVLSGRPLVFSRTRMASVFASRLFDSGRVSTLVLGRLT